MARRTWAYFDNLVMRRTTNWLPPDNIQEHPTAVVAHRTSPTNIGLALLSNLSAHDFGYLSCGTTDRARRNDARHDRDCRANTGISTTGTTRIRCSRSRRCYISTVDSGNLCAHLLTLQSGLRALPDRPIVGVQTLHGLHDTLAILVETAPGAHRDADRAIPLAPRQHAPAANGHIAGDLPRAGGTLRSPRQSTRRRFRRRGKRRRRRIWAGELLGSVSMR